MGFRLTHRGRIATLVAVVALAVLVGDWASYDYGSASPSARVKTRPHAAAATSTSDPAIAASRARVANGGRVFPSPIIPNSPSSHFPAGLTTTRFPRAATSVTAPVTVTTRPKAPTHRVRTAVTTTTRTKAPTHRVRTPVTTTTRTKAPTHRVRTPVTTTTTTIPSVFATRTLISGGLPAPNELVVSAGTYCILCTTRTTPTGGQESISLVDTTSGSILATWTTTTTSKVVGIVWSCTTSPTGVDFVLDASATGDVTWSGPASVLASDVANDKIGVQASFSGSAGLSPSESTVAVITI